MTRSVTKKSQLGGQVSIGGPLARTQPFEKFFSKPDFGGPHGLFPAGNPSIEVGSFAPHLKSIGFPEGRGRVDPQNRVLRNIYKRVGSRPGANLLKHANPRQRKCTDGPYKCGNNTQPNLDGPSINHPAGRPYTGRRRDNRKSNNSGQLHNWHCRASKK